MIGVYFKDHYHNITLFFITFSNHQNRAPLVTTLSNLLSLSKPNNMTLSINLIVTPLFSRLSCLSQALIIVSSYHILKTMFLASFIKSRNLSCLNVKYLPNIKCTNRSHVPSIKLTFICIYKSFMKVIFSSYLRTYLVFQSCS